MKIVYCADCGKRIKEEFSNKCDKHNIVVCPPCDCPYCEEQQNNSCFCHKKNQLDDVDAILLETLLKYSFENCDKILLNMGYGNKIISLSEKLGLNESFIEEMKNGLE